MTSSSAGAAARWEWLADPPPVMRIWQQAAGVLRHVSLMGKAGRFTIGASPGYVGLVPNSPEGQETSL